MVQYDLFAGRARSRFCLRERQGCSNPGRVDWANRSAQCAPTNKRPCCKGDDVNGATSVGDPRQIDLPRAIWRGALRRCPRCGRGVLFKSYLKQVDACATCHEEYAHIRADDAPPWLTILIVGHIVVPLIFVVNSWFFWPNWLVMLVWPIVTAALALTVLPRAKGIFIAIIWATRAPGSERR
jgi:uncharacterized protein (DUF983 family)